MKRIIPVYIFQQVNVLLVSRFLNRLRISNGTESLGGLP
ncbi:putative metal-dependent membrane protease [Streptococcus pneumoniae]|nr:putative metal-dependent membrane protease [Streptococcus pneumoniae]